MCGIAGIISLDNQKVSEQALLRIRDSMIHRGPDDSGYYINDECSVGLAHRRLSIIDLSSFAHQPMSSADGKVWVVYNGEIYNFRETRKELLELGHSFHSDSDTEVILRSYLEWGEQSFQKLSGMFAFCIYDRRSSLVYLVRDHAGIKPLYCSISENRLIFSSEVKALKAYDSNWNENSEWRIYFLLFGHIPEPFTTFKDVFMLPKGSYIRLDLKTKIHETVKYSEFRFSNDINDADHAVRNTRDIFERAVERHMISDAQIGVFLSGGIDSSLIAIIARKHQIRNLRTLSVVFDDKELSEKRYQDIVLEKIKSDHHSYNISERDFVDNLDNIFGAIDQPTTDGVNTYFISKCAHEAGLKSVLSGIGGDELFGGYPSFSMIGRFRFLHKISGGLKSSFNLFSNAGSDRLRKLSFLSIENPVSFCLLFRGLFSVKETALILDTDERQVTDALEKLYIKDAPETGKKNFLSWLEINNYMQNQLLRDSDFMGMRHSVEIRVPFLDRNFMRFLFSVNEDIRFRDGVPKYLLVKSFEDLLPKEIASRKKQGFTLPMDSWLRKGGKGLFKSAVLKGGVNRQRAERLWDRFENGRLHWSRVWGVTVMGSYK